MEHLSGSLLAYAEVGADIIDAHFRSLPCTDTHRSDPNAVGSASRGPVGIWRLLLEAPSPVGLIKPNASASGIMRPPAAVIELPGQRLTATMGAHARISTHGFFAVWAFSYGSKDRWSSDSSRGEWRCVCPNRGSGHLTDENQAGDSACCSPGKQGPDASTD